LGWQLTSYALLLALSAALSAALALYARSRREAPGAREVALLMLALFAWCSGYALESASTDLVLKVFWAKVEYAGITAAPVAWLAFALAYTGRGRWLTRRNLALLAIVPVLTLLLVATNGAHGLVWSRTALDPSGAFLVVEYGAWFWVFWAYSYSMLVLGTFFLVSTLLRSSRLYRRQGAALLVALAAPWVGNGMYVLGLNPFPYLDLTPFAFLLSGAALSWGLFRFRFLDIVPVARDALVEGMEDGVIVVDPRGRVVDLNPAARRILGVPTAAEAVGEDFARLSPALHGLIEGYSAVEGSLVGHKEVELGEGRRSYDLALSSLRDRGGRRTGRLLVLRDVTQRRRAEEESIRRGAELARSNAELEHFAYLIAHDLRAPLRGINGFSQILLDDHAGTLDDEARDYLLRIRAGTLRMGRLIDELLELSRLTRAPLRRETVDLGALARDVASELKRSEPGRAAEFVIAEGLVANGDPRLLRVALWNLLGNAWKFTRREPRARIELGVDRGADRDADRHTEGPIFFVRDNGVGFEMAYSDKLFGTFQRLHSAEEFEGTGIGLATVQRVVERHGGEVWAEGEVGRGATFYFTLSPPGTPDAT
jgi:PAS domain S-box-containing protein